MGVRLIQVGTMHGAKVDGFDPTAVMKRRLILIGFTIHPRTTAEKGRIAEAFLKTVWPVLEAGGCSPVIHPVFPLSEAAAAHRQIALSAHLGKIILKLTG